jgi:hypothetical protein
MESSKGTALLHSVSEIWCTPKQVMPMDLGSKSRMDAASALRIFAIFSAAISRIFFSSSPESISMNGPDPDALNESNAEVTDGL